MRYIHIKNLWETYYKFMGREKKLYVIFPMAGEGARFGYVFKPFLKATENTFIEIAKSSFDVLKELGYNVEFVFAYRKSQEESYKVSSKLHEMFSKDVIHICLIENSVGPLDTLQQTVNAMDLKDASAFVCDCDHRVDITPMLPLMDDKTNDVIVPIWNITPSQYGSFGKVRVDDQNKPLQFVEKEIIPLYPGEKMYGILGCHYFQNLSMVLDHPRFPDVSSLLQEMIIARRNIRVAMIHEADFFGTPAQLDNFRFSRAQTYTIFVDVDGVIVHQETKQLLQDSRETLEQWKKQGHTIVLTSASSAEYVSNICTEFNLPYDHIIADLSPGPRVVVNDSKPYLPFYRMADGIALTRNTGIYAARPAIEALQPPLIEQVLPGASFAQAYVVTNKSCRFVRKHITKTNENKEHVITLRRQHDDLQRWGYLSPGLVPALLYYSESSSHLYFDMEYLEGYQLLSRCPDSTIYACLDRLMKRISHDIYPFNRPVHDKEQWMNTFLKEKIYPKLDALPTKYPELAGLLHHEGIYINGVKYPSISTMLSAMAYDVIAPDNESMIHGDLTLENIMYSSEKDDIKVIDHAGSRYVDAKEMDIGKLFQSILCAYHTWDEMCSQVKENLQDRAYNIPMCIIAQKEIILPKLAWLKYYHDDPSIAYDRGVFFMTMYFIRMLPFFVVKSMNHAKLLIFLAHVYLDKVYRIYQRTVSAP